MIAFDIKKNSRFLSALAILGLIIASPYLAPIDPDSAVLRSGTFAALLFIGFCYPVKTAFERHSLRALLYGNVFALIFALCLGIGSELAFYDQLLPGFGSLIRRFAVPILATPALGACFSYPFACNPSQSKYSAGNKPPFAFYFLLFSLCYSAILLALFPGVISYDFEHEIAQYQSGIYQAAHPVFHTLFLGTIYAVGEALFGSMTAGAALYSVIQLLLLAAMYAYTMVFVQQRISNHLPIVLLAACFALLPFHGVLAVSTAKDPLFSGLCVLLCTQLWAFAEDRMAFITSLKHCTLLALTCLGLALLRHNGVFSFLPVFLAIPALCLRPRKQAAIFCVISLACCLVIPRGLERLTNASATPSSELMSIPCQQLMRTANRGNLSENEFAEISSWFSDATHRYRPHIADPAKGGNFDLAHFQRSPGSFLRMYLRYGLRYPRIYIEAFLENSAGIWNPGDISHAHALSSEQGEFIYLNTVYPFDSERYPIEPGSRFPALTSVLYRSMHSAEHEKLPFLAQLFCPAIYSLGLLLTTMLLFFKRRRAFALCTLPLWGIFLSILFSAGVLVRYAYPIMAAVPVLLALALHIRSRE